MDPVRQSRQGVRTVRWPALVASLAAMALLTGAPSQAGARLTLQARRGLLGGTPPANMPRGPVPVPLPLYPGAAPYYGATPRGPVTVPSSPYLKAATAAYVIHTNWLSAESWYDAHMTAAGYRAAGGVSFALGGSPFAPAPVLFFQSRSNPELTVDVGFPDVSGRAAVFSASTVVQYWVVDVVPPPRPRGSLLPADVVRVVISALPDAVARSDVAAQTLTATITRPAAIARLVAGVNALVEPTGGVYSCPASSGGMVDPGADLAFVTANGRAIPVTITLGCPPLAVVAKRYDLSLSEDSSLWTDVVAAVGF